MWNNLYPKKRPKHGVLLIALFYATFNFAQQQSEVININTTKGHTINIGASGFNVRIADKSWNYTHPDFRKAVHQLKPGWLRYFSGTMGDAFSSATGLCDLDYAMMFNHSNQYLKGYRFTDVKGPHRIADLYDLLGEINGKLIVTVNGFSETPEMTKELARFCKNNNIEVAAWQFCNEPYFYVPHRNLYWWNDGYDYATKMKPHADAIREVFPEAFLALNFTWDGIWDFMKEINTYQKEHGAYWNVFSKHSYAPHTGKKETLAEAYRRGNTKLLQATNVKAMKAIEQYTSDDIPMIITEFGIWNRPLHGIYYSIYNIEYVMRQLQHTNTRYVGAHEVSNKFLPEKNINKQIEEAYKNGININTDSISTGINKILEGKAYEMYHEVTSQSNFIFETHVSRGMEAPGMKGSSEQGFFAQSYNGINGYDYLVFTNRTKHSENYTIHIDGKRLEKQIETQFIHADSLQVRNTDIKSNTSSRGSLHIPAFSVTVAKWKNNAIEKPIQPTIYKAEIKANSVELTWGPVINADEYVVYYGNSPQTFKKKSVSKNKRSVKIQNLKPESTYFFKILAKNEQGESPFSKEIIVKNSIPETPEIFKTAKRNNTATLFWKSVANATAYKVKFVNTKTKKVKVVDANNVYGFRVKGLDYSVPYQFSVAAYNGMGTSEYSKSVRLILSEKIPYSPRNVSAKTTDDGEVEVKWIPQKEVLPETTYNIYRGEELHKFNKIGSGVKTDRFIDSTTIKNRNYYYTVKAETSAGESNFYPNIATLIRPDTSASVHIKNITKQENGYLIEVTYKNLNWNRSSAYGVKLENISYLTVEEQLVAGRNHSKSNKTFEVFIQNSELRNNSKYAIKGFIYFNGKRITSKLTNKIINTD